MKTSLADILFQKAMFIDTIEELKSTTSTHTTAADGYGDLLKTLPLQANHDLDHCEERLHQEKNNIQRLVSIISLVSNIRLDVELQFISFQYNECDISNTIWRFRALVQNNYNKFSCRNAELF